MSVTIQIPADIESELRAKVDDLDGSAKETLLVEFYRQQKITRHQLARALNVGLIALDEVLKKHHVFYQTDADEVFQEAQMLGQMRADADADRR